MDIGSLLPRHAKYRPEHLCLVFGERRCTYKQFNAEVNRLANALLSAGLKKGDKVATVLPNCFQLMAAYWAVAKTGMVIVPGSPLLQAAGLQSLLRDSDTKLVLADASFADVLGDIIDDLPDLQADRCVVVGDGATPFQDYDALTGAAAAGEPPDAGLTGSDDYNIMYTSGTTGAPKGIVHTHFIRAMYGVLFANAWRMTPESVVLHAGAIVFNGAMLDLMPWMYLGGTYVMHAAFNVADVIRDIDRERVTHIVMVPSQIIALLNHEDFSSDRLASLEMILSVGAPLLLQHKKRLTELLPGRFYELYGLTEGFVTILDKEDALRKAGSVGCPPAFYDMAIRDEDGNDCDTGQVGEICGRGPLLMKGYYNRPDLTNEAIVDGWLRSGDLGYVDDEGFLFLVDRKKDMIVSGGVNVYPKDIEETIAQHDQVREAAVFGVPHPKWGETPVAAVILNDEAAVDGPTLCEWTNQRVGAKFQRISDVTIVENFPRNVAGKTLKRELREAYLARHDETLRGAG